MLLPPPVTMAFSVKRMPEILLARQLRVRHNLADFAGLASWVKSTATH